jgi:undecaprenyl diphosphate synthase
MGEAPVTGFDSSTRTIPERRRVPRHIAMIMDGNGRWAKKRLLPRIAGHRKGVETVRLVVEACADRGVEFLTLFAFSSENWRRPADEVSMLMQLFVQALEKEIRRLNKNGIRLRVVGDLSRFNQDLRKLIAKAEETTAQNKRLALTIAANYGGRWDILQAVNRMIALAPQEEYSEADLAPHLAMAYAPEPDLFIRTGGEQRISNFLLWQLAYTELFFTSTLWPDFDAHTLDTAIESYRNRERRFGRTSEQLAAAKHA